MLGSRLQLFPTMFSSNFGAVADQDRQYKGIRLCWLLLVGLVMLTSCSVIPPYPESLPALVEADTVLEVCPPIAGRFSDVGNATTPDGRLLGHVSLTQLLHPALLGSEQADVVVVRGPELELVEIESFRGEAQVAAWRQPKVTKDAYLSKGDRVVAETYLCQKGFVRLGRRYDVGVCLWVPGLCFDTDFLWLRKSVDGSLIVLHTLGEGALIYLALPVGQGDKIWYRFPPAQASSGNMSRPRTQPLW